MMQSLIRGLLIAGLAWPLAASADDVMLSERASFRVERIADGLEHPWAVAFLPDGGYPVTERPGRLRLIDTDGRLHPQPTVVCPTSPRSARVGYSTSPCIRTLPTTVGSTSATPGTRPRRRRHRGRPRTPRRHAAADTQVLFSMRPKTRNSRHFGSRLVFDNDSYLFITLGDRGDRPRAQVRSDHVGGVIRLHDDGRVPDDNPFVGRSTVLPEIYSYGHRNIQGATLHPQTGRLWTHEHGPQGGDEINLPEAGLNYGWPVITYGVNYGIGTRIGEGTEKPGMEQPLYYWVPSIAPSGMAVYDGGAFPQWRGNVFVGSLKFRLLVRLEIDGGKVVHEERMLQGELGRIRDVRQGPDGLLYLLTDADDGQLVRLRPAD